MKLNLLDADESRAQDKTHQQADTHTLQSAQPLLDVGVAVDQHGQDLGAVELVLVELLHLEPLQQESQHAQRRLAQRRPQARARLQRGKKAANEGEGEGGGGRFTIIAWSCGVPRNPHE